MENGFLSRVSWSGTLIFMLIRVAFGTVGIFLLFLIIGSLQEGSLLAIPIVVVFLSGMSLVAAWLSKWDCHLQDS